MTHPRSLVCPWLGLALIIGAEATALADEAARIDAGAFLGGNYFSDELELGNAYFREQIPESAFLVGLRGSYSLLHLTAGTTLAVELETKLALSQTGSADQAMRDSYFAPVLGWRAQAVLDLWNDYRLHPFVVLGFGGETVFSSSPFVASGDSDAATYWGVGARYALSPRYGIRGDFRHGVTAGRIDLASSTVEAHVGFYYAFSLGSARKASVEVAAAESEAAVSQEPIEPEDKDEDGIPDADDACPEEAELVNDLEDEDGCPEPDADDDGLFGALDKCPEEAEDRDSFEDDDGCPEPDNDQDAHADASDECPDEAETANGFDDEDGCPDDVPERIAQYIGVIEGIRFGSGSARIQGAQSRTILDEAAAILLEYPSVSIRISGYTDNRGNRARNVALSRARADAVKWYLVDRGIEHTRLLTMGYGPEQPIAENDTPAGRAKNRRIEFELLTTPIVAPARPTRDEATQPADATGSQSEGEPAGQPPSTSAQERAAQEQPARKRPAQERQDEETPPRPQ
ncbi:MAG TPA: OmpA family protein [Haliangium sp.]|nr:OmpA family protein [Haliangium sp.]